MTQYKKFDIGDTTATTVTLRNELSVDYAGSISGVTPNQIATFDITALAIPSGIYTLMLGSSAHVQIRNVFLAFDDLQEDKMAKTSAVLMGNGMSDNGTSKSWIVTNPTLSVLGGDGIAVTSTGVAIDLPTDGGLEIDTAKLQVKTYKTLEATTNGLAVKLLATSSGLVSNAGGLTVNINDSATSGAYTLWSVDKLVAFYGGMMYDPTGASMTPTSFIENYFFAAITFPEILSSGNVISGYYYHEYAFVATGEYGTGETYANWAALVTAGLVNYDQTINRVLKGYKPSPGDAIYGTTTSCDMIYRSQFKNMNGETTVTTPVTQAVTEPTVIALANGAAAAIASYLYDNPAFVAAVAQNEPSGA